MDRVEGLRKLSGRELYVDDLQVKDCLWGATVRSQNARGRITSIEFGASVDWSEFVIVDHHDIPGPNEVASIERDQPVLAADEVRHVGEPVVLLAHPSREMVRRAAREVQVHVEPRPAVLDYRLEPTPEQIQFGDDNLLRQLRIEKGDVEAALAEAAQVVEGVYETGAQEHVYIETQGMLASVDNGVLTVRGSMQCPYYVLSALMHALNRGQERTRVVQSPTGGGFGGKEDYPSVIALHAALLALKAKRPVKLIYDRGEDMLATTKRHPSRVRHRTGLDAEGRLVAQDIEVLLDGGAYVTLSPVVLSRAIIHAAGPYHCPNVRIRGAVRLSNLVPFGAFRGFGAPQTQFANERHLDVVAGAIGMDPIDLRRRNLIQEGQATATGQVIADGADRQRVIDRALVLADYQEKKQEHRRFNAEHSYLRRGIGLASFYHGAGFTGSGEVHLASKLHLAGLPDGTVEIRSAAAEMGQGVLTVHTKLACDRLGVGPECVRIAEPDTARVPDSGPTVASRSAMIVGRLIEDACDDLRRRLGVEAETIGEPFRDTLRAWHRQHPGEELLGVAKYRRPAGLVWDDQAYQGDAYGAFAWSVNVAEVEVDLRTFTTRVIDFVAVQEVGKVLNETIARGQIQGGVVQGIGWALLEECTWSEGRFVNGQLTNYILPTSADTCPIRVEFHESAYEHGPQGAKGIGELPINGPAPAIANAVADATGANPTTIPLTPERLMELLLHADAC